MAQKTVLKASPPPTLEFGPNSTVTVRCTVSGDDTLLAFERAAAEFAKDIDVKGFRKGTKVPTQVVASRIGADVVKSRALQDLSQRATARVGQSGEVALIGESVFEGGEDAVINRFNPGAELQFAIKCEVFPKLKWLGTLADVPPIKVAQEPVDGVKVDQALQKMRERYLTTAPTSAGYASQLGDVIVGSMKGFLVAADGSKGTPLPNIASGDNVEIVLESGRFMPGLVEGLVGSVAGDVKDVRVSFPNVVSRNLGADLAGKATIFEVSCAEVRTRSLPKLDDAFANSVRPGLTYDELYKEVRAAVGEEGDKRNANTRNSAIEEQLVKLVACDMPASLVESQAKEKFAMMMAEQREAGVGDADLKKMVTKEGYEKYKRVASKTIVRTLLSSMVVEELSVKEGIKADPTAVEDQLQLMKVRAEQAKQEFVEADAKGSIEATLKREAVLDWVASKLKIEYTPILKPE